jgi:hypothetical protein
MAVELDASASDEAPASNVEMMSMALLLAWLVLTLYRPNLRRVRSSSARDLFLSPTGAVVGTDVGAGSAVAWSLFWLAHSS